MSFLKQNKVFTLLLFISIVVLAVLFFLNSSLKKELDQTQDELNRTIQRLDSINDELSLYSSLDLDHRIAVNDLAQLAEIEKNQKVFWKNLLNPNENHFLEWKKLTPEAVNGEITKLFTNLRNQSKNAQLSLPSEQSSFDSGFSNTSIEPTVTYGFGLSAYDGFWPSFNEEESKKLDIQGKIIKDLVGFLCNSKDEVYPISLLQIKRESVGPTDLKHIASDKINLDDKNNLLLRNNLDVKSLVFELKFRSHTSHARSFVNQLRPPFLIRNFKVERLLEDSQTSFQGGTSVGPFGGESDNEISVKKLLPIVTDVKSDFTILIEYLISSREGLYALHQKESLWVDANSETYVKFLTDSGNDDLIKEAQEILFNDEDN